MKSIVLTACVILVFVASCSAQSKDNSKTNVALGDNMPTFELQSNVYGKVKTKDLKGKVVLITLFATWCGPCQSELNEFQKTLWPKYKDNKKFRLLVIGREHTDADLKTYNERKHFSFPLYPDPKREVFSKFADQSIPRSYLVGKNGKIIYVSLGFSPDEFEKLMQKIEKALE